MKSIEETKAGIRHILVSEGIAWNKSFAMADTIYAEITAPIFFELGRKAGKQEGIGEVEL